MFLLFTNIHVYTKYHVITELMTNLNMHEQFMFALYVFTYVLSPIYKDR